MFVSLVLTTVSNEKVERRVPEYLQILNRPTLSRPLVYAVFSFPFLSENDLQVRWTNGIPLENEVSYMLLVALCAVSAQSSTLKVVSNR
jgi:hypothetical protein